MSERSEEHRSSFVGPELQVILLAAALVAAAVGAVLITPNVVRPASLFGDWTFVVIMVMFGLFEFSVFYVRFAAEGLSFAINEIPMAFAIVCLEPIEAPLARLPLTVLVLVFVRDHRSYKLVFNIALFLFEITLMGLIFNGLLKSWGGDNAAVILAVVIALIVVTPLTSILISIAISRFEGDALQRVITELKATWWMYTVNVVLAAMTIALALIEPFLTALAILPIGGMWYVLHSYGIRGQELRDLNDVHGFAGRVGGTLDVQAIGDVAVDETMRLFRSAGGALIRFTPDGSVIHTRGVLVATVNDTAIDASMFDITESAGAEELDPRRLAELGLSVTAPSPIALMTPINDGSEPLGLLVVVRNEIASEQFDEGDRARLDNIAHQLAVSLRRGMLHERLEFEARHDALTNLPARTLFERHVAEAVARANDDPPSWVVMLDLDRFKEVNDTLGHHAGDDLLIQFAGRMSSLLEADDVLARLAGDEFAILCTRDSSEQIVEFAQSCVVEGGRPVILDELEIVVTVSVGVAQITRHDQDAVQPMRRADIAMYNAKWQRTGVEFYRDEIDRRTPARLSMLGDLRTAIESDQLDVVYQPKLHLATGSVVGVEALVRWTHPTRGVVSPNEFVRVAEDTGLIKQLTDLVLAHGIQMLRNFEDHRMPLGLAVNLSTHDLFDSRLPDRVRAHLEANGVAPASLTLEITESSLFVDAPRTRATIDELHGVGLRMAVDDFGTGYSSLSYLRRLPVHELKIDQSFVAGMLTDQQDEVIVRSTVDLGHNLGLLVVAEGVESVAILERLRHIGCDVAQGFIISEPLAADELIGWLQSADGRVWMGSGS